MPEAKHRFTVTRKQLVDWGGQQVLASAEEMVNNGSVTEASYEHPFIRGVVTVGGRPVKTALKVLDDGTAESHCPCYMNRERSLICSHVIALALSLIKRNSDPLRELKYNEEIRRTSRLAAIDESAYLKRADPGTPGAKPANLRITFDVNELRNIAGSGINVKCGLQTGGRMVPLDEADRAVPFAMSREDQSALFVLEDISEGPARGELVLNTFDFINVLDLHRGRNILSSDGMELVVNQAPMRTNLRVDFDPGTGELVLGLHTELPFMTGGKPVYIVTGKSGWVYGAGHFWPLEAILPAPYHSIYRDSVRVGRPDVLRFMRDELPDISKHLRVESDISIDLFSVEPARPVFHLKAKGSCASLSAVLCAKYGELELPACKPDARERFGIPDPDDLMRYTVRNTEAEEKALALLKPTGFAGERGDELSPLKTERDVMNFLASHMPALRREAWKVDVEGMIGSQMKSFDYATPVARITDTDGSDWFDVRFEFEDGRGSSLSNSEIQEAIRKGSFFIRRGPRTVLIDSDAVESMQNIFSDCATGIGSQPGSFRMSKVYAPFVKSSLDALDGIDVEDTPSWRNSAGRFNRASSAEPVNLSDRLEATLRSYQKEGVYWLRFLEKCGFCGLLADEMGLGKTVQTLAWLSLPREGRGKTALIVCPTSLVENWADEAGHFVPEMKIVTLVGPDRQEKWELLDQSDIAITSYAILRRDLERYLLHNFSAVILDEAQHIKNKSTQNALAAKQIRAGHKLVLTGTPVENGVSDIWSIMDFLMPGYLGSYEIFRHNYEIPISNGRQEGHMAQVKLRRKLHPFLMRRLKTDVAKDLPDKIEKVSFCPLSKDQRMVYDALLQESRRKVSDMVAARGFNKSRMEILSLLTKLRQTCCHLGLLNLPGIKAGYPSAKTDLFFELLDEAMDSGHRMLVFSQFVSMLAILRGELEKQGIPYCYLDGSTKDRMSVVRQFNLQKDIPLFLISLKAGGTGLNLTGADMVVHFDPWWNPAVEDQATDRAHRIGQRKTVYSVKLITRDTVEEKVLSMQKSKRNVIDATIGQDETIPSSFTWENIQQVLDL